MANTTSSVDLLLKFGLRHVTKSNLQKAHNAFEKAYKMSANLDEHTQRTCAFNLGAVNLALGNTQYGLELLKRSKNVSAINDTVASQADVDYNLGLAYEQIEDYDNALKKFSLSYEEFVMIGNDKMQADSLVNIANALSNLNRTNDACQSLQRASKLYELGKDEVKYIRTMIAYANMVYITKGSTQAMQVCDECVKACEKIEPPNSLHAFAYNAIALIYMQCHEYKTATTLFEKALSTSEKLSDELQTATILQNLGAVYTSMQQYTQALQYHESAASKFGILKNRQQQGQCFFNLAFSYSQLGDLDNAYETLLHALLAATDSGDKKTEYQVLERLGAICFNQGKIAKAIMYFKKALSSLVKSNDTSPVQERIVEKLTFALEQQIISDSESLNSRMTSGHRSRESLQKLQESNRPRTSRHQHSRYSREQSTEILTQKTWGMRPGSSKFKTVPRGLVRDVTDLGVDDTLSRLSQDSSSSYGSEVSSSRRSDSKGSRGKENLDVKQTSTNSEISDSSISYHQTSDSDSSGRQYKNRKTRKTAIPLPSETTPLNNQNSKRICKRRSTPCKPESLRQTMLCGEVESGTKSTKKREDTEKQEVLYEMARISEELTEDDTGDDLQKLYEDTLHSSTLSDDTSPFSDDSTPQAASTTTSPPPPLPTFEPQETPVGTYLIPQTNDNIPQTNDEKTTNQAAYASTYAIIDYASNTNEVTEKKERSDMVLEPTSSRENTLIESGTYESLYPPTLPRQSFHRSISHDEQATNDEQRGAISSDSSHYSDSSVTPLLKDTDFSKLSRAEKEEYMYTVHLEELQKSREKKTKQRSRLCSIM